MRFERVLKPGGQTNVRLCARVRCVMCARRKIVLISTDHRRVSWLIYGVWFSTRRPVHVIFARDYRFPRRRSICFVMYVINTTAYLCTRVQVVVRNAFRDRLSPPSPPLENYSFHVIGSVISCSNSLKTVRRGSIKIIENKRDLSTRWVGIHFIGHGRHFTRSLTRSAMSIYNNRLIVSIGRHLVGR